MPFKLIIELSDRDLRHFRRELRHAREAVGIADDEEILGAAADLVETLRRSDLPDFVAERMQKLEILHAMLSDADWPLKDAERSPVLAALAYVCDPEDIIPDNIPGIAGVGPKTAVKWLVEYGSIEGILANAAAIKPPRFQEILPTMADRLALNRRLITFDGQHLPASIPAGRVDVDALCSLLQTMEMKSHHDEARRRYSQGELAL